ncbi:MAG: 2-C-methyl-D-erythritol 4-phosphate cytidylyltransferase [Actinomycetia bacterium]|nr:2-C-methyl-D-erythritol 4-phosphate cytidylyltransferase [Actinomycetes bacterium]
MSSVWAVLVAAGRGERLGSKRPKAFAVLGGRPLLAESLERLDGIPRIERVVAVVPPKWEEPSILCAEEVGASKLTACIVGGETRTDSVRIGIGEVPQHADVILIHDAARPLLRRQIVDRLLGGLGEGYDGAVPGLPVADTIKRAPGGTVVETLDRSELVAAQTPQVFAAGALRRAFADADSCGTDCAALVERAGGRIRVVPGDPDLLKVTTPEDLAAIEQRLAREAR